MLSGGELKDLYSKAFAIFEAEPPSNYLPDEHLRKLTSLQYVPVFVFVDATGKKVLETRGFRTEREARAMHEFVTKRHYQTTSLADFLAKYPQ